MLHLLFVSPVLAKDSDKVISYEVSPSFQNGEAKLTITLLFKTDKTGETKINLPNDFAGQEQFYKGIQNVKVKTPNANLADTDKPEIKKITHLPNEKITIEYDLIQDWIGNPSSGDGSVNAGGGYRPVIKKNYFHFLGIAAWIVPSYALKSDFKTSIVWKDFPKDWNIANSFGANQTQQTFRANYSSFLSSVFVGGDFRINQRIIRGKPIYTAVRGKWNFSDMEFSDSVQKILEMERVFWNDFNYPHYLVTLLPLELGQDQRISIGGTGLTNSFATFIAESPQVKIDGISFLIAHEYFHNWNTKGFGGLKQPEGLLYWFSEGFTDFYTYRLLHRAGMYSSENYVARYNNFIKDYYLSKARNEKNQRIADEFFTDFDLGKLPYRRGFLLATKWNKVIRKQSNGKKTLDNVMLSILKDYRKKKFKEITKEYLISVFSKYAKYDFAADVENYIENGQTIGDFNGVFGDCLEYFEQNVSNFELGFALESLSSKVISGVINDSAAYQAGLRNGQKIVERKPIRQNDSNSPVEMTIEDEGQKKSITYLPQGKVKTVIPQFKLRENISVEQSKGCFDLPK